MRVLYFHQYFSTKDAAGGARSYEFARALLRRGHEVTLVCGSFVKSSTGIAAPFRYGRREAFIDGIRVIELDLGYSNHLSLVSRALRFCWFAARSVFIALTEKYDVLFATSTPLTIGLPGIAASVLRGKVFVFEVRDLWPELPRAMGVVKNRAVLFALDLLETVLYRSAKGCVGLAPGIVKGIVKKKGGSASVEMIPNACDLEVFFPQPRRLELLPREIAEKDFVAVFSGAHGMANGLDAVLDAAKILRDRGRNDIWFVLVGDGKLKPRLVTRAKEEGLHQVLFLDPVPRKDLGALLASCHVGLQILANVPAFYYGTSPNKFFDYLSTGLPVLTNYPGWVADLVTKNDCGVAVSPDDAVKMAEALEGLETNRARLKELGARARQLAEREFNRVVLADKFVNYLEKHARTVSLGLERTGEPA